MNYKLICLVIVLIGAINWGLLGVFDLNFVEYLFGNVPILVKSIYVIIGLSGLILVTYGPYKKEEESIRHRR